MPLLTNGVYAEFDDKPFEAESSYYLSFQINSALFSIKQLLSECIKADWENRCQYYHYYSDHLLYSVGQIANRFVVLEKDKGLILERKLMNCKNYRFTDEAFPILSDKRARNMVEHIDEYNQKIIQEKRGVGGFNLIDNQTDTKLITTLRTKRDSHPYTLDLLEKKLLIRWRKDYLDISIAALEAECIDLQKNVKSFRDYLT